LKLEEAEKSCLGTGHLGHLQRVYQTAHKPKKAFACGGPRSGGRAKCVAASAEKKK